MRTVEIYSTPTCGFCKALKAFLDERKISHVDHDVSVDENKRGEMEELSGGLAVPVVVFDKGQSTQEVHVGFDKNKVKKVLNIR